MVDCRKYRKLINLYLDGEADDSQAQILFSHTEKCSKCQARFEELREPHKTIKSVSDAELPADFRNSVMESIRIRESEQRHRFIIHRPVIIWVSIAAMAMVMLAFTMIWRVNHTSEIPADIAEIHVVSPREDAVVNGNYVDISAVFNPSSMDSIRVILDGRDVTEATEVNEDFLIHASDELQNGYHMATIQIMGDKGLPITQHSWAFYVMKTEPS